MLHTIGSSLRRGKAPRLAAAALVAALVAGLPAAIVSAAPAAPATPAQASPSSSGDISPAIAAQIGAIAEEKADRTPAEQKVDSNLLYAVREDTTGLAVDGAPQLRSSVDAPRDATTVDITATVSADLVAAIEAGGGTIIAEVPAFDAVRAELPLDAVVAHAARPDVREVRPADVATTNRAAGGDDAITASVGAGLNEADVTHGAATARTAYGVDGTGVKVCVLSDGVTSLAARQATGDLPAVDVLPGQAGTGDEGTAMLELIHDIAPGAELGFATAFTSLASFAQNILDLRTDGCEVIVDDITYYSETTLQDGPVAKSITTVRSSGAIYFTSAGNSGNLPDGTSGTWQGDFDDEQTSASPLPLNLRLHGWGQSGTTYNTITKTGGPINLQWSDPVGASANDYDLYVLNSTGTAIIGSSTNVQSGTQNPAESYAASAVGNRILVTKTGASASRYLVLYTNRGQLTYGTGGGGRAHNVSLDAVSVAATPAANAVTVGAPTGPYPNQFSGSALTETFSSDGPTRQFYTPAGVAITPGNVSATGGVVRNGVDITAADGATTTTPGFTRFFGTSAAAPNAAALAALALEAKPLLTPLQLENALGATAIDIEAVGYDPVTGAGVVMASPLLSNVGAVAKAKLSPATRSVTPQTGDGDAFVEPGETATITQQLTNIGSATATGISATLVSDSANATIVNGSVTYGNIAAAATGSPNSAPFRISVPAGCPCGTTLPFTLTVTYAGGTQPTLVIPVKIVVGEPSPAVVVPYAGAVVPIPDNSTTGASATVSVPSGTPLRGLDVTIGGSSCNATAGSTTVGLDHSFISDLKLTLTSPSGTTVTLMNGVGGAGNNLCQTVFSDAGSVNIQDQLAEANPFTGTFRPAESLGSFAGEDPQGTWTLKAVDSFGTDTGSIRAFSLQLSGSQCSPPTSAPVATADSFTVGQGQVLAPSAPGVLGNDTDANSDPLTASLVAGPAHGTLSLQANGSFTYTPTASYVGPDSFTYKASDGTLSSATTTVSLAVNGTPTAVANSYTTSKNTTLSQNAPGILGNDTDPEGNALTAILGATTTHGTLTLSASGAFAYVPTTGYVGPDSFTYRAKDAYSSSALVTVGLTVNAPPVGVPDGYTVGFETARVVAAPGVLGNDSDPEGNALTAILGTTTSHGTLALAANGSFTYTPAGGYSGPDSFTYRAKDATGQSALTAVSLTVAEPGNEVPVAVADSYRAVSGVAKTIATPGVLGNDTDGDGDALTASIVSTAANGTVSLLANGSFTYTSAAGFTGTDTFAYRASDGAVVSGTVVVSIEVISKTSAYVAAIYTDFLTRVADGPGLAYWGGRLDRGVETRASFVLKMSRSHEYGVKVVKRAFVDVLGREVDPSGREYWATKVQNGMPISDLVLNLISSNEYLTKSGGTVGGFVDKTYQAILGRPPTAAERTAKVNAINAGTTRLRFASDLYKSTESRQRRVRVQYVDLLNRQPTTAELNDWVAKLATKSDIDLAIALGSGTEYYNASLTL